MDLDVSPSGQVNERSVTRVGPKQCENKWRLVLNKGPPERAVNVEATKTETSLSGSDPVPASEPFIQKTSLPPSLALFPGLSMSHRCCVSTATLDKEERYNYATLATLLKHTRTSSMQIFNCA